MLNRRQEARLRDLVLNEALRKANEDKAKLIDAAAQEARARELKLEAKIKNTNIYMGPQRLFEFNEKSLRSIAKN